jgi:uncharacterized coiled-coil DUF342 family protein
MTISIELLALIATVVIAIVGYIISKSFESEKRGALMERIKKLEEDIKEMRERHRFTDEKVGDHGEELASLCKEIEGLRRIVEGIDVKLDKALSRQFNGE